MHVSDWSWVWTDFTWIIELVSESYALSIQCDILIIYFKMLLREVYFDLYTYFESMKDFSLFAVQKFSRQHSWS